MMQWIFSERERGFEVEYAHEQELEFRVQARRDHLFGLWAAQRLGYETRAAEDYAAALVALDVHPQRPEAVIARVVQDLRPTLGEAAIRIRYDECGEQARRETMATQGAKA